MKPLYEISKEYLSLQQLDDSDEFVIDTLEALKGTLEVKATNVAKYIGNLYASATAIDNAMKQMTERKKALENKADRIKKYLHDNMVASGIHRIEAPEFVIKIVNNPPKVVLGDEDLIPTKFKEKVVTIKINKNEIKKALSNGKSVSGAKLQNSTRVEIK